MTLKIIITVTILVLKVLILISIMVLLLITTKKKQWDRELSTLFCRKPFSNTAAGRQAGSVFKVNVRGRTCFAANPSAIQLRADKQGLPTTLHSTQLFPVTNARGRICFGANPSAIQLRADKQVFPIQAMALYGQGEESNMHWYITWMKWEVEPVLPQTLQQYSCGPTSRSSSYTPLNSTLPWDVHKGWNLFWRKPFSNTAAGRQAVLPLQVTCPNSFLCIREGKLLFCRKPFSNTAAGRQAGLPTAHDMSQLSFLSIRKGSILFWRKPFSNTAAGRQAVLPFSSDMSKDKMKIKKRRKQYRLHWINKVSIKNYFAIETRKNLSINPQISVNTGHDWSLARLLDHSIVHSVIRLLAWLFGHSVVHSDARSVTRSLHQVQKPCRGAEILHKTRKRCQYPAIPYGQTGIEYLSMWRVWWDIFTQAGNDRSGGPLRVKWCNTTEYEKQEDFAATTYHDVPLRTTTYHYVPLRTTTYHYVPLRTTTYHYVPLRTTTYHYVPLRTTTYHYVPLRTTTYHYVPLRTTTYHYVHWSRCAMGTVMTNTLPSTHIASNHQYCSNIIMQNHVVGEFVH